MKLALPKFQFRFMPAQGNVIFPGNFHPVGTQAAAREMLERAPAKVEAGSGGLWLVVGGSGGFGSACRVALASELGAHTLSLSLDQPPNPESNNKIRKIGSPGWHRNKAIEAGLIDRGLRAESINGDAFDPSVRTQVVDKLRADFEGHKLAGVVWALAAPRGLDPRTGKTVSSVLRPLGKPATIRTFSGADADTDPKVATLDLPAGTPEEAIRTKYVMGGRIVELWLEALLDANVVDEGFTVLTLSYRGGPLNEAIYRKGLIGLAKADLEFYTKALDVLLRERYSGRAIAVEAPAVVTEASGGIPGVPFYMALLRKVLGDRFEDPLASMTRMLAENLVPGSETTLDDDGLLRMDDREMAEETQAALTEYYEKLVPGATFPRDLYDDFMVEYGKTRGFHITGVDYDAEFDTDEITA